MLMMVNNLVGGFNLPLWKMMDFVTWDDDIPNTMGIIENSCSKPPAIDLYFHGENKDWPLDHIGCRNALVSDKLI